MDPTYVYSARVLRIVDGDTLDVEVDMGFRTITRLPLRIAHIDAPERYTEEGRPGLGDRDARPAVTAEDS